jgi:hypothetical protein
LHVCKDVGARLTWGSLANGVGARPRRSVQPTPALPTSAPSSPVREMSLVRSVQNEEVTVGS